MKIRVFAKDPANPIPRFFEVDVVQACLIMGIELDPNNATVKKETYMAESYASQIARDYDPPHVSYKYSFSNKAISAFALLLSFDSIRYYTDKAIRRSTTMMSAISIPETRALPKAHKFEVYPVLSESVMEAKACRFNFALLSAYFGIGGEMVDSLGSARQTKNVHAQR